MMAPVRSFTFRNYQDVPQVLVQLKVWPSTILFMKILRNLNIPIDKPLGEAIRGNSQIQTENQFDKAISNNLEITWQEAYPN